MPEEKEQQRTNQHSPLQHGSHPQPTTNMCPWPPLQPDLPSRPTSPDPPRPTHAIWYSGNFEQKRLRGLNVRKKWNQTYRKPCEPHDVSIYTHLININLVSFYILYHDIRHPRHNLNLNNISFFFILLYFILSYFIFEQSTSIKTIQQTFQTFINSAFYQSLKTALHKNARGQNIIM